MSDVKFSFEFISQVTLSLAIPIRLLSEFVLFRCTRILMKYQLPMKRGGYEICTFDDQVLRYRFFMRSGTFRLL